MVKAFMLIAFLLELYPQGWSSVHPIPDAEFPVRFRKPVAVEAGAPVMLNGQVVGRVKASGAKRSATTTITIQRSQESAIRDGAIVLVSSHFAARSSRPVQFVEILSPASENAAPARAGKALSGYASFHEFWSSRDQRSWVDQS